MSDYASILSAAAQLPATDRERLIDDLTVTLLDEDSGELSPEWTAEIERRTSEIASGGVETVDWETVRQDLFRRVGFSDGT